MSSQSLETTSDEDQVWDPYNILDSDDTDNTTPPDESHPWDMLSSEEQQLTMQWSDALQIDHRSIKPTDNFFELGGDSMTAMQLATDMPGKSLLVSDVFKAPTLADMARVAIESALNPLQGEVEVDIKAFSLLDSETDVSNLLKKASSQCQLDAELIEDIYPCTQLQKGVMALSLLHPGIYMEQHVYSIPCSWDLDSFKSTWSTVVRSCEALRTRIVHIDSSEWFQVVDHGAVSWTCATDVDTYLENDRKRPMGLGVPLIRCAIIESESPKFVLTIHHAVEDGWSLKMIAPLVNEAHLNGGIASLGSFKSFIKYLSNLDNSSSKQHWQSQLDGASPSTFPPLPSPTHQPRADREIPHFIPLKKNSSLRTTLSTSIRAAWAILQSRYLDDAAVVYGETLSGRHIPLPKIGKIFGPTITTVPVRLNIDKEKSVSYTLDYINNQYANMMAFEQFGLHNIQALGDSARRACAFQSLLVIHPEREDKEPEDDKFSEISLGLKNYLSYGLTVECQLATDGVSLEMSFDPGVISDTQVKRIIHQFTHVLRQISNPSYSETALKDIEITSPEDKVEIMKWNDGPLECLEECVFHAIETRSQNYLDSLAIDSWDGKASYRQLSDWSSSLAALLVEREVGPEKYVALCFEKSMWTIVAIMAVMKAGGAFVLLDRTQPVTRLQKIVQTVDATLLLSSAAQLSLCSSFFDKVLVVEPNELKAQSVQPPNFNHSIVNSRNAVYATFTSGSTGEPKGIVIENRNCISGFEAQIKRGLFSRDSRVLQFTSYSFDTCIEDILATLLAGGCICVPRDEDRLHDLPRVINEMNVNLVQTTTSAASLISPGTVPTLRTLRQGGEPMAGRLIDRWTGTVQVENSYGPSECTVTSSIQTLPHSGNPTNIGNGVGCLLWIAESTDPSRLAPIGTTGELLVQGPIVGRGYINRNEATVANFVSNSFLPETDPSAAYKVYRTGDMAKYNDDGTINIIGRKDNQVKLHGQRIELGDIESHLLGHEYVKTAVAELPVAGALAGAIVAVVQLNGNIVESNQEFSSTLELFSEEKLSQYSENLSGIRNRLRTSLPSYMVPTVIIPVRNLPTLVTGKLDRNSTKTWLSEFTWEQKAMIDRISSNADPLSEIPSAEVLALDLNKRLSKLLVGDNKNIIQNIENRDFLLKSVGLDSIKVVSLSRILEQEYGLKVPIKVLNSSSLSVRGLARHITREKLGQRPLELSQLDVTGELSNLKALLDGNDCGTVLLTGATGYLGAHILKFLLKNDRTTKVIAHVRAQNHEQGLGRVMRAAQMAKWWDRSLSEKLEIWPGDLGQPRLGLSTKLWNRLKDASSPEESVNCVVHCGAMVNWSNDYHSLKSANVMSTLDLLRCARLSEAVRKFVYISCGPQWDPIREDTDELLLKQLKLTDNGYGQSKIMSELLVRTYASNPSQTSTETSIIKPGFIIGSPETGVVNSDDFIWRMVAAVIAIGGYDKESADSWIFVTSADRIAELVLDGLLHDANKSLAVKKASEGITVGELWGILGDHFGYKLSPMAHLDWAAAVKNDIEKSMERHPLWPVYHLIEQNFCALGYDGEIPQELLESDRRHYVKSSVISSVEYLIKTGFLSNPKRDIPMSTTEVTFDRSGNHL